MAQHSPQRLKSSFGTSQQCLPHTTLQEEHYDLVISTDAIAYLQQDDFRLYFSELARLVKPQGSLICSTPIDIHSEDALERFIHLAETEFEIEKWVFSYHAYFIRLTRLLASPLSRFVRQSRWLLLLLEKVCRLFSAENGISHVILLGRRRPLYTPPEPPAFKQKRRVWE